MRSRSGVVLVATLLVAGGMQEAEAHSLAHADVVGMQSLVSMIDGKDRNESVTIRYDVLGKNKKDFGRHGKSSKHRKDGKHKTPYLFGYFEAGEFNPLTGKKGKMGFAGGSLVDFAIAEKGADGTFGTDDDVYYRLSDAESYANLYFRSPVRDGEWCATVAEDDYFRKLMIVWDTDRDGKADFMTHLRAHSQYDGMAVTAVPLPAAGWLFASGLLGLGLLKRRRPGKS